MVESEKVSDDVSNADVLEKISNDASNDVSNAGADKSGKGSETNANSNNNNIIINGVESEKGEKKSGSNSNTKSSSNSNTKTKGDENKAADTFIDVGGIDDKEEEGKGRRRKSDVNANVANATKKKNAHAGGGADEKSRPVLPVPRAALSREDDFRRADVRMAAKRQVVSNEKRPRGNDEESVESGGHARVSAGERGEDAVGRV